MAKIQIKPNPRTTAVLDDLEKFLEFSKEYGYRFNEADLYNFKTYSWQQYSKFVQGKNAKNMWEEDLRKIVK